MPQRMKPRIGAKVNTTHPLSRALVGYWLFNEGGGGKVWNIFNQRHNGTMTNMNPSSSWVSAQRGVCLNFDGSNDYITCGSELSNTFQTSYSIWARVRFASTSGIQPVVSLNVSGSSANGPINLAARFGTLVFRVNDSAFGFEDATVSSFNANTWYDIVGTRNGNTLKLYVNALKGTDSTTSIPAFGTVTQELRFANNAYESSSFFSGIIDRVALWNNRELTEAEIRWIYYDTYCMLRNSELPRIWIPTSGSGTSITVNPSTLSGAFGTGGTISFILDQILSIAAQTLTLSAPAISFSTEQILAQTAKDLTFALNSPTVTIDVSTAAGVQVGTFGSNTISYITDHILSIGAQSQSFSIPVVTVLAGGDVLVDLTNPLTVSAILNAPDLVTDAVLDIGTSTLVLVLNPTNVAISTPSTAKVSSVYIVLGIR